MNKTEFVSIRGEFTLVIRDKNDRIIEKYVDKNLIVNVAKTSMSRLIAGAGASKNIDRIAFGTNGTAPDVADTAITGAVTKSVTIDYPEFNSARFSYTLGLGEGNGTAIAEFGLLSVDGSLFARKTRSVINKTSDIQFSGTWKISF